jgi:hypothetical protein
MDRFGVRIFPFLYVTAAQNVGEGGFIFFFRGEDSQGFQYLILKVQHTSGVRSEFVEPGVTLEDSLTSRLPSYESSGLKN